VGEMMAEIGDILRVLRESLMGTIDGCGHPQVQGMQSQAP